MEPSSREPNKTVLPPRAVQVRGHRREDLPTNAAHAPLHVEYVFSVFKMRLRKRTDTRIQNGWLLGRKSEYILTY